MKRVPEGRRAVNFLPDEVTAVSRSSVPNFSPLEPRPCRRMRVWVCVWGVESRGEIIKGGAGWRGGFVPSGRLDGLELSMAAKEAAGCEEVVG